MNAVIYARYSSDNQREESIEGQLRECTAYCQKNDITIVGSYIDRALSAKTDNRPEFQRMIKDSAKGVFDTIVVWKLDRFARNRYDSAHYKQLLRKRGVKVVSATENISDGPEGIILESMLEGMAEYYSAELAEKVVRGQTENALRCKYNGGRVAFGYKIDQNKDYQIDSTKAPLVLEIFTRYANGETMNVIRNDLNRRGVTNTKDTKLDLHFIPTLLHNRKYIGEYKYRDIVIPGGIPALVPQDLFDRVQCQLKKNCKSPARYKATEPYLLATKLFCGTCGGMMVGESGRSAHSDRVYHYYRCTNTKKRKTCTSSRKTVRKQPIEDAVVHAVMARIADDEFVQYVAEQVMAAQQQESSLLPTLRKQLSDTERGISNVLNAIEAGIITDSTKQRLLDLENVKKEIERNILQEELQHPIIPRDEIEFWICRFRHTDIRDMQQRQQLIDSFVNAVVIYDDRILITFNYKDGEKTIRFSDLDGSDMEGSAPPQGHSERDVLFYFSEAEREIFPPFLRRRRRRRDRPQSGNGRFSPREGGCLFAAFGGGGVRMLRRAAGELLPGGSRGRAPPGARGKRGYRTP